MNISLTSLTLVSDKTIPPGEVWVNPEILAALREAFRKADFLRSIHAPAIAPTVVYRSMGDYTDPDIEAQREIWEGNARHEARRDLGGE